MLEKDDTCAMEKEKICIYIYIYTYIITTLFVGCKLGGEVAIPVLREPWIYTSTLGQRGDKLHLYAAVCKQILSHGVAQWR